MEQETKSELVWRANPAGNFVMDSLDQKFFISYAPDTSMFGPFFAGDGDGNETALYFEGKYYILNGDHREAYEERVPLGIETCLEYFDMNINQASSWSEHNLGARRK